MSISSFNNYIMADTYKLQRDLTFNSISTKDGSIQSIIDQHADQENEAFAKKSTSNQFEQIRGLNKKYESQEKKYEVLKTIGIVQALLATTFCLVSIPTAAICSALFMPTLAISLTVLATSAALISTIAIAIIVVRSTKALNKIEIDKKQAIAEIKKECNHKIAKHKEAYPIDLKNTLKTNLSFNSECFLTDLNTILLKDQIDKELTIPRTNEQKDSVSKKINALFSLFYKAGSFSTKVDVDTKTVYFMRNRNQPTFEKQTKKEMLTIVSNLRKDLLQNKTNHLPMNFASNRQNISFLCST